MLKVITESVYQTFDKTNVARIVTLNISKLFDEVWYADLLRKIKTYGLSGRIFYLIHSFVMKAVMSGQILDTFILIRGPNESICGTTLFLHQRYSECQQFLTTYLCLRHYCLLLS